MNKRKETVFITGATSGIGFSMATKFAREGYTMVLLASDSQRLKKCAMELHNAYPGCVTMAICQDLSQPDAAKKVYKHTQDANIIIDILINNAGFGLIGEETRISFEREKEMLMVNIMALTQLCHLYLEEMYQRESGKILNVASIGAFQPGPYTSAYYASKAYVASFSQAIRLEAAKHNVQVCTLCPGTTKTEFFVKTGGKTPFYAMPSQKVAELAYEGLMKNKRLIIPGRRNQLIRCLPMSLKMFCVAFLKKRVK